MSRTSRVSSPLRRRPTASFARPLHFEPLEERQLLSVASAILSFSEPSIYGAGVNTEGVAVADFDHDGILDLALASSNLSVLFGKGDGSFSAPITTPSQFNRYVNNIAAGDVNNDGNVDLVIADADGAVEVLLNDGTGSFTIASQYTAIGDTLTTGDYDQDGNLDLVVTTSGITTPWEGGVLLGDGNGSFIRRDDNDFSPNQGLVVSTDFNGDGNLDLAVSSIGMVGSNGFVMVALGKGTGDFSPPRVVQASCNYAYRSLTTADFNNDGRADLAFIEGLVGRVGIIIGYSNGEFSPPLIVWPSTSENIVGYSIAAGDLNGDGFLDLAATYDLGSIPRLGVFLGDGSGALSPPVLLTTGNYPRDIVIADFNGDGKCDLAAASIDTSVLLNTNPVSISNVVVAEARRRNGLLESNDRVVVTWAVEGADEVGSGALWIDEKPVNTIYGPYHAGEGRHLFAGVAEPLAAGEHKYAIELTDAKGNPASAFGTFYVLPDPSGISGIVVAEAAGPRDGRLESNEPLVLTWAFDEGGVYILDGPGGPDAPGKGKTATSASLTLDGKSLAPIYGPYATAEASTFHWGTLAGPLRAGAHDYVIEMTRADGSKTSVSGYFDVAQATIAISDIVVAELWHKNGQLDPNESGVLTWAAHGASAAAKFSFTLDGRDQTQDYGPFGRENGDKCYAAVFARLGSGEHTYTIKMVDYDGSTASRSGTFTVPPDLLTTLAAGHLADLDHSAVDEVFGEIAA